MSMVQHFSIIINNSMQSHKHFLSWFHFAWLDPCHLISLFSWVHVIFLSFDHFLWNKFALGVPTRISTVRPMLTDSKNLKMLYWCCPPLRTNILQLSEEWKMQIIILGHAHLKNTSKATFNDIMALISSTLITRFSN